MKRSSGFTLIELMVVIGIMILISSIVVTGSFGMSRASGYMAAESVVYNTLQAARQKACTDGKRVLVAFVKIEADADTAIDDYSLVTVEAAGTIDKNEAVHSTFFYDRTSTLANFQDTRNDGAIWNLDTGVCVQGPFTNSVTDIEGEKIPSETGVDVGAFGYSTTKVALLPDSKDTFSSSYWKPGHAYGFQMGETQEVPMGFKLKVNGGSPEGWRVRFEPDGRSSFTKAKGGQQSDSGLIEIYEEIAPDTSIRIRVDKGSVKVENRNK
jgi:prepilin-type N-terminal cleavage/methylation domain-containing protein